MKCPYIRKCLITGGLLYIAAFPMDINLCRIGVFRDANRNSIGSWKSLSLPGCTHTLKQTVCHNSGIEMSLATLAKDKIECDNYNEGIYPRIPIQGGRNIPRSRPQINVLL